MIHLGPTTSSQIFVISNVPAFNAVYRLTDYTNVAQKPPKIDCTTHF